MNGCISSSCSVNRNIEVLEEQKELFWLAIIERVHIDVVRFGCR